MVFDMCEALARAEEMVHRVPLSRPCEASLSDMKRFSSNEW